MQKKLFGLLILTLGMLAACQPAVQGGEVESGATSPVSANPTNSPAPTHTALPATPAPATPAVSADRTGSACTAVSKETGDESKLSSLFDPISASDWGADPETATVTILEYGDFQ